MISPDETGSLKSEPRFHRGQIVFREWGNGSKEIFLIHSSIRGNWYFAYEIQTGYYGDYNLENLHDVNILKFNCSCRLMEESDGF